MRLLMDEHDRGLDTPGHHHRQIANTNPRLLPEALGKPGELDLFDSAVPAN